MKILQRNLNRGCVRNEEECVCSVCVCSVPNCYNILISGKIIKEMPGSVASGTHCIIRANLSFHPSNKMDVSYICNSQLSHLP
jgi:hypothetical protein